MEFVAKDINGDWFYEGGTYFCVNSSGEKIGKMHAEYVPDPLVLWQSKCDAANIHITSQDAKKYKSSDVIYKLWEHKNANVHNTL